jgi:hypothetical protein
VQLDRSGLEELFWEILRAFEDLAVIQYENQVPPLATAAKRDLVERLEKRAPGATRLNDSVLAAPVRDVLSDARKADATHTLIVQGLVLENLGQAIYSAVDDNPQVSEASRRLALFARAASDSVTVQVPGLLAQKFADGEHLFNAFAEHSHEILMRFDAVGGGVDSTFAEPFGLHFKDIAGTFVARLIPACTAMGMARRKVVSHLAGSFMGL